MSVSNTVVSGLSTIGNIQAIITLVCGVFIGLILTICGLVVMIRNKKIGVGLAFFAFGVLCIGLSSLYYYIVINSKTASTIVGAMTLFDVLTGGKNNIEK